MSFWTNDQLLDAFRSGAVTPFDPGNVQQAAYELGVANEFAITSADGQGERRRVPSGEDITIPSGQFALLLTEEIVKMPAEAMGFISVKATWKLKGLVNVSGFHVDPGFHGRLRFAVYNASGQTIRMSPGRRVFQLWLSRLVEPLPENARYQNKLPAQAGIQDSEVTAIAGMVASPAGLSARIDALGERLSVELPRLESSLLKVFEGKAHELALQIASESNKLSERLTERTAGVSALQKAQWVIIAALVVGVITQPLARCSDSKSKLHDGALPDAASNSTPLPDAASNATTHDAAFVPPPPPPLDAAAATHDAALVPPQPAVDAH